MYNLATPVTTVMGYNKRYRRYSTSSVFALRCQANFSLTSSDENNHPLLSIASFYRRGTIAS
ncbi:MAG: hypothetical protein JWQ54_2689 [Mucilaginibacter sp.]|nr:hypothetical protein [Mucilaginibacter sp.]